jgi:methionyl-tRNA synthetase
MGKKYSMEDLERAVSAVKDGGISIREAESVFSALQHIRMRVNEWVCGHGLPTTRVETGTGSGIRKRTVRSSHRITENWARNQA